jgi:hypothetical protein
MGPALSSFLPAARVTHTPAPWAFDGIRVYAPAHDDDEGDERGGLIALVYAPPGVGTVEGNADLIAAAPLMVKALHDVWVLAETLDIGNHERAMFRDAVSAALDAAFGGAQAGTP